MSKLIKGSKLACVTTLGLKQGDFPLYNLVGLSEGKLRCIISALTERDTTLAHELLQVINQSGVDDIV